MLARNFNEAQEMMLTLETALRRYSLELNINKTKYMASTEGRLTYQDAEIEQVKEHKYLGKIIQQNLQHDSHLTRHLRIAEITNA